MTVLRKRGLQLPDDWLAEECPDWYELWSTRRRR